MLEQIGLFVVGVLGEFAVVIGTIEFVLLRSIGRFGGFDRGLSELEALLCGMELLIVQQGRLFDSANEREENRSERARCTRNSYKSDTVDIPLFVDMTGISSTKLRNCAYFER